MNRTSLNTRVPFSRKILLASTALVAAGAMSFAPVKANAENPWGDAQTDFGSVEKNLVGQNQTDFNQLTDRAGITANLYIGNGQTVNIVQPGKTSMLVAKDNTNDPTQILGNLNANGQVMILDRNGVLFGQDSKIDVGGIIASTGDVDMDAIKNGSNNVAFSNFGEGAIDLQGQISVSDAGLAAFVSPVIKNSGVINAKLGKVALASGQQVTLDFYGDQLVEIAADSKLENALIENAGTINAEGGTVVMTARAAKDAVDNVINMSGVVNASSATVQGGKIVLDGGDKGLVTVSGEMNASGTTGGEVVVDAQNTYLTKSSKVDVSSNDKENGTAGAAVLWGRDNAIYAGEIDARGQDGFVETSGGNLGVHGDVLIGQDGEWLLDPTNITIVGVNNLDTVDVPNLANIVFSPRDPADGTNDADDGLGNQDSMFWVWDKKINNALNSGANVTLETHADGVNDGDILVRDDAHILKTGGAASTLLLKAHDDIIVNGTIGASGAAVLNVGLTADFDGSGGDSDVVINNTINTNGGWFGSHASDSIDVNAVIDATGGSFASFLAPTVNLAADVKNGFITGTASTVNVLNDTAQIQDGVDAALTSGPSVVNVASGSYHESVRLYKDNMTLNGANAGIPYSSFVFNPASYILPNSPGVHITGDNVTVDGFWIQGATGADGYGIWVDHAANATLKNNVIYNVEKEGIFLDNAANSTVTYNQISDAVAGVYAKNSNGAVISYNEIFDTIGGNTEGDGILLRDSQNALIEHNNIYDVGDEGIFASGNLGTLTVQHNTINNTGLNTDASGNGIELHFAKGKAYVANNTVTNADYVGIWIKAPHTAANGFHITDNTVDGTAMEGILVEAKGKNISGNTVDNTGGHGISVLNSNGAQIRNNKVGTNGDDASILGDGIHVETSNDIFVTGNEITNTDRNGQLDNGSGIEVLHSSGATIGGTGTLANVIYDTDWDGIRLEGVSGTTVTGNDVDDSRRVGIYARDVTGLTISNNDIDGAEEFQGINVFGMHYASDVTISGNQVDGTNLDGIWARNVTSGLQIFANYVGMDGGAIGQDGIEVFASPNASVTNNYVNDTAANGIYINRSDDAYVAYNVITNADENGILVNPSDDAYLFGNTVSHVGNDGIRVEGGTGHYIGQNRVMFTGQDGIHVLDHDGAMFGNADIVNNTVVFTDDDGIEVSNGERVNIDGNILGHIGYNTWDADGIRVEDVAHTVVKYNGIADVLDDGVRVKGGSYAGIFGNNILLTGDEGIEVSGVNGYSALPDDLAKADVDYPTTGYAVSIEGNEVALTGDHGIYVHDSENTRIINNDVLFAGVGQENVADYVNSIGAAVHGDLESPEGFVTAEEVTPYFILNWGNGDGIKVENVYGPEYSGSPVYYPTGASEIPDGYLPANWAVQIQGNDVAWTGGDGIDVNNAGSTLIGGNADGEGNSVYQAGINWTDVSGSANFTDWVNNGPFTDEDSRRVVWWGEDMTAALQPYLTEGLSEVGHDTHDGIRATNIRNDGSMLAGITGDSGYGYYGYALNIIGNDINTTGDDGIEAGWASSALIQNNQVSGAGIGTGYGMDLESTEVDYRVNYGVGDYFGADGINAHDVYGETGYSAGSLGSGYEEYALVIDGNTVNGAADDGIEVVGAGRTLITGNNVMNVGLFGNGFNSIYDQVDQYDDNGFYADYSSTAGDGYGADGIHARGVFDHTYNYEEGSYTYGNGLGLEISNNTVDRTGDDGIEVLGLNETLLLSAKSLDGYGYEGLRALIDGNRVTHAGYGGGYYYGAADGWGADGIHVRDVVANGYSEYYDSDLGWIYTNLYNTGTSVTISNNYVDVAADDGIQVLNSGNSVINNNEVYNAGYGDGGYYYGEGYLDANGADGIHVKNFAPYGGIYGYDSISLASVEVPYFLSTSTNISNNTVNTVADDGIDVEGISDVLVDHNDVDNAGDDGIEVVGYFGDFSGSPSATFFEGSPVEVGILLDVPTFTATISNNTVDNTGDDGITVENLDQFFIQNNTVNNTGTNLDDFNYGEGIQAVYFGNGQITGNTISNNFGDGIFVDGYNDEDAGYSVLISGNDIDNAAVHGIHVDYTDLITISNNDVSNSGEIGILTRDGDGDVYFTGNTMTDNPIGASFESGNINMMGATNRFIGGDIGLRFVGSDVTLTDNDPLDIFEGSLGTSLFDGQSQFFVQLTDGALFEPGQPSLYDASQGTYLNYTGTLEDMFYHFVDDNTLGLFFFGGLDNVEDIFNTFGEFNGDTSGLSLTITGLPFISQQQGADFLNNITPAAGGEDGIPGDTNGDGTLSAEEAAALDPAAGAENVGCWGDALSGLEGGATVNYSFDTSDESALSDTASCGLAQQ